MTKRTWAGLLCCASLAVCCGERVQGQGVAPPPAVSSKPPVSKPPSEVDVPKPVTDPRLAAIDHAVDRALMEGRLPGCVVVVGRREGVLFRKAYGFRAYAPDPEEMTLDTVFDLASLTKPVATASSIMVLVDRGRVGLDEPAARYVPEFGRAGKGAITLRHLLTHVSGLPVETPVRDFQEGREVALGRIYDLVPRAAPGQAFVYSDVGFLVLEEVIKRVTGQDVAVFAAENVFRPLGMVETGFLPGPELRARAAVTEQRDGVWMRGQVHDPRAFYLGGVAGHAGLFSTAEDLTRYARALLAEGDTAAWSARTQLAFLAPHDVPGAIRALGWDVRSAYSGNRGEGWSPRAVGHGGYTGTVLWVDPERDWFVIVLSNRVHPEGRGNVNALAGRIGTVVAQALESGSGLGGGVGGRGVWAGIDVLRAEGFRRLRGAKVGLVTNAAGRARDGRTTVELLAQAEGVRLEALFSPEHGMGGDREGRIDGGKDAKTGLPVYSLYGRGEEGLEPSAESLASIDTLVVDLQDVGVRFYTYASTLRHAMAAAARHRVRVVVLDRPNPIDGVDVAGPVLTPVPKSFVNENALPVRHGMTLGELSLLFNAEHHMGAPLEVVTMKGWQRADYFDRTGLAWTPPSPNLRTVAQTVLYPAVGLLESTNLSVGRGTDTPFEILGAPWIDGPALASALRAAGIAGLTFRPVSFTPKTAIYAGQRCGGVRVTVSNRAAFEPARAWLGMAMTLHTLHPKEWHFADLDKMLADRTILEAMEAKRSPAEIEALWAAGLRAFKAKREKYLLYGNASTP
ncbi:exo-beta-N-acetylmuramidase NamZ domain-containing protein [Pendulispora albinea]|uniref:DUF1343 domain-containing protein n=1 Tax=Pendulispora albinea TaxID=2741071 RepID=A0ABZ2LST1_9BACT